MGDHIVDDPIKFVRGLSRSDAFERNCLELLGREVFVCEERELLVWAAIYGGALVECGSLPCILATSDPPGGFGGDDSHRNALMATKVLSETGRRRVAERVKVEERRALQYEKEDGHGRHA